MAGPPKKELSPEEEDEQTIAGTNPALMGLGRFEINGTSLGKIAQKEAWDRREVRRAEAVKKSDEKRRGEQVDSLTGLITRENTVFTADDTYANPFPFVTGMNVGR